MQNVQKVIKCNGQVQINERIIYDMRGRQIAYTMLLPIAFTSLHWAAAQTYAHFCAPPGFHGFVVTFFNVANPVCSYALQVMDMSKHFYNQSWIFIGITTLGACKYLHEKCTTTTACIK